MMDLPWNLEKRYLQWMNLQHPLPTMQCLRAHLRVSDPTIYTLSESAAFLILCATKTTLIFHDALYRSHNFHIVHQSFSFTVSRRRVLPPLSRRLHSVLHFIHLYFSISSLWNRRVINHEQDAHALAYKSCHAVGGSLFFSWKKIIEIGLRRYLDATIDWLSVCLSAAVVVQRKIDATGAKQRKSWWSQKTEAG